jgi:hypothetical protein
MVEPVPNRWFGHLSDAEQMIPQSVDSIKLFADEGIGAGRNGPNRASCFINNARLGH